MHPQLSQGKGSNGRQAETQVRLDALTRQSWGDGDASTVTMSQRKQRQASRDTSPAWCINTTVLGGTVMPPQWPQAKASSGRQAETQVRLDALTRQSWGDGDASTVTTSQRKQRQASRDTSHEMQILMSIGSSNILATRINFTYCQRHAEPSGVAESFIVVPHVTCTRCLLWPFTSFYIKPLISTSTQHKNRWSKWSSC